MSEKYLDNNGKEYSQEAYKTIKIIEKECNIDWSDENALTDLIQLDLSSNQISDITPIEKLTNLTSLNLYNNQISDITPLEKLTNLTSLDLFKNDIANITPLEKLSNLTSLNLIGTQISDITPLEKLTNITSLELSNNQISDITPLEKLTNLTYLNLRDNQISDITPLGKLTNLIYLSLSYNKISDITPLKEFIKLDVEVKLKFDGKGGIVLEDNPIEEPPLEILSKGNKAIFEYLQSIEDKKQELNELKILFIGDGGAGKTSLIKKSLDNEFDTNENMTHGINILDRDIKVENKKIKAHFWDFGGQEMMHSTHQFFLSRRSLYVLVLDGRKEEDSEYWLNFIRSFGGNSPVLVVLNKIDDNESFELNRKFLQDKYPNIIDFYRTSCLDGRGVEEFYQALKSSILKVETISTTWGRSWLDVKEHIENLEENFINRDRFLSICKDCNVPTYSAQKVLSEFLDNLGIAIHFDKFNLNEIHTLKPEWVTDGVYKIITSKILSDNRGVLDIESISTLLNSNEYPSYTHKYIIELMKEFELCYSVDDKTILIPALLEVEEKEFNFDYYPSLRFELEYSFLPLSVMDKFIVKSHSDIKDKLRWRSGVVLEDKNNQTEAVIKVDNREKRIFIYVNGKQKRDLFAVVRKRFNEINSTFKEIKIDEWIPLPSYPKNLVKYKHLIGLEQMGEEYYISGELGKKFEVSKLLNGIERAESRKNITINNLNGEIKVDDNSIKIGGNNSGVANTGNNNTITQNITTTNNDLKELLENFKSEANEIIDVLPEDKKDDFKECADIVIKDVDKGKKSRFFDGSIEGLVDTSKSVGTVMKNLKPLLAFL